MTMPGRTGGGNWNVVMATVLMPVPAPMTIQTQASSVSVIRPPMVMVWSLASKRSAVVMSCVLNRRYPSRAYDAGVAQVDVCELAVCVLEFQGNGALLQLTSSSTWISQVVIFLSNSDCVR